MPIDDLSRENLGANAGHAAAEASALAIDEAVKVNEDPAVAEALREAVVRADQAASRTGWLRGLLRHRIDPLSV